MNASKSKVFPFFAVIGLVIAGVGGIALMSTVGAPSEGAAVASTGPAAHSDTTAHAANVQSFGNYHVEAQVTASGSVTLYLYSQKVNQLMPIPAMGQDLGAGIECSIVVPGEDAVPVTLTAKPLPGEPSGQSSRFVGSFARREDQGQVGLTVNIPLEGQSYRVQWRPETLIPGTYAAHQDAAMPAAIASTDEAQKLFLTPGGVYTEADIAANGRTTASQKYAGLMAKHGMDPPKGARICPVTATAADARFAWQVGGKKYLFCCPPCIEEFVKQAKEKPETVAAPETYIKK